MNTTKIPAAFRVRISRFEVLTDGQSDNEIGRAFDSRKAALRALSNIALDYPNAKLRIVDKSTLVDARTFSTQVGGRDSR